MPVPTAAEIVLTDDERDALEGLVRRRTSAQALALRARIVLAAADGLVNGEIAEREAISRPTVTKWRNRFAADRLDGLVDEPRPGRPRTITDDQVEAVLVRTLESKPKDATHWSTRSMAREVGVTQNAVLRIWHAYGLKPHLQDTFKLSTDPWFVDKVHDIVGLYLNPPERAVVLCVDEKSQIQALDRTQPILPLRGAGPDHRQGPRSPASPPPRDRVQEIPAGHRRRSPRAPGRPPRARQLLHAQDAVDQALARRPSALQAALHADVELVDQPRRTLVRGTHHQVAQARRAPLSPGAQ
jgi:transposase